MEKISIEFTDEEMQLVLKTISTAHVIEKMMGKDGKDQETIIGIIHARLEALGKLDLFLTVYKDQDYE